MIKQNLSQRQVQKLSPQQIQLMKLLQVPTAALEQRIKEEMEGNPALEEGQEIDEESKDEFYDESEQKEEKEVEKVETDEPERDDDLGMDDYLSDYLEDDTANYKLKSDNYASSEDDDKTIPIAVQDTFHEHLETQLGLANLNEHQTMVALQIIGSIDDDGYLRRDTVALVDDLAFSQNVTTTEEEVLNLLTVVQEFDPAGIGSRNLQECLAVQLKRRLDREELKEEDKVNVKNAHRLIVNHFDEFSKKHYDKLQRQMGLQEIELKNAIDEILKLNPKPASGYGGADRMQHYIIPDFIIKNENGVLELTLNTKNAPDLRISDHYKDMLKSYGTITKKKKDKKQREAVMFIKQKIDAAKWFIDAIRQRQQTMYKTMYSILQYQHDFFLTGDQKVLRPMILKDIADITGLDISTVSRVANSKYVQTEFGTKRLKGFFSESLQTASGEEVSTLEVKKILTELIEKESKRKPLSDEKLKDQLRDSGYNIARRTVAKYREQLNIPVARLRKEL